jgi:hypothetical protein
MARLLVIIFLCVMPVASYAARGSTSAHGTSARSSGHNSARAHKTHKAKTAASCATCARDRHGRIRRDSSARNEFMHKTGYPHGRKGYVVDHIVPLECGGSDTPANMQWQSKREAKAKDKTEAKCR